MEEQNILAETALHWVLDKASTAPSEIGKVLLSELPQHQEMTRHTGSPLHFRNSHVFFPNTEGGWVGGGGVT